LELNQGHTDFQSDALPPELRHHFCFAGAKVGIIFLNPQENWQFLLEYFFQRFANIKK
jgi:hypothetical protein